MESVFYLWIGYSCLGGAHNFCFCFIYDWVCSCAPSTFSHCVWSRFEHSICISVKKKGRLIRRKIHSISIKMHSIRGHPISPIPLSFRRAFAKSWDPFLMQFRWCRKVTCHRLRPQIFLRLHWGRLLTVKNNTGTVRMTATMTASRTVRMRMSSLFGYLWRRFDCTFSKTREKRVLVRNKARHWMTVVLNNKEFVNWRARKVMIWVLNCQLKQFVELKRKIPCGRRAPPVHCNF